MPIPWKCLRIGDVNRDGDTDSFCTVRLSTMTDTTYIKSIVRLSSEEGATHQAEEAKSCKYEKTPLDTYYRYKRHLQFCTEGGDKCFRVTNRVLDKNGFSRKIEAFEISIHPNIAMRRIMASFNAVIGDCELVQIDDLKSAPPLAKTNPTAWNIIVGIIIFVHRPDILLDVIV